MTRPTEPTARHEMVNHFRKYGWVVVDAVAPKDRDQLSRWVDEVASMAPGPSGVLQHFEGTDTGPLICRSENFVPVHEPLRRLLCGGEFIDVASALIGEPAVLYKEKINYKLPGGAGYSAHQDAPAYPMIDAHVSAMIAVDDADESNGGLEVVSCAFDAILPMNDRGCIEQSIVETMEWSAVPLLAGQSLWFHSRTPHRSVGNRSAQPRRALFPTYNALREGDLRSAYYEYKLAAFETPSAGDRARVSLIGDFEGRPVD